MEKAKKPNGTRLFREAIRKRSEDGSLILYIVEVHEDEKNHQYFINIRHIIENRTNIAFPISLCKSVVDKLLESKETVEENPVFKLDQIKPCMLESLDKMYFVEIKPSGETPDIRVLHAGPSGDAADLDQDIPWNSKGSVELNSAITGRMIKVLIDIMIRYQTITDVPEAPSLYSPSGGRRFFFDVRETRWGKRLQISQLTHKRRNTVGIPLENLIQFRERIDFFIKELSLEDTPDLDLPQPTTTSKTRRNKKPTSRGPPKPRKMRNQKENTSVTPQDDSVVKDGSIPAVANAAALVVAPIPVPEIAVL